MIFNHIAKYIVVRKRMSCLQHTSIVFDKQILFLRKNYNLRHTSIIFQPTNFGRHIQVFQLFSDVIHMNNYITR